MCSTGNSVTAKSEIEIGDSNTISCVRYGLVHTHEKHFWTSNALLLSFFANFFVDADACATFITPFGTDLFALVGGGWAISCTCYSREGEIVQEFGLSTNKSRICSIVSTNSSLEVNSSFRSDTRCDSPVFKQAVSIRA